MANSGDSSLLSVTGSRASRVQSFQLRKTDTISVRIFEDIPLVVQMLTN